MNSTELSSSLPIVFRPASPEDFPFICKSWLKTHRESLEVRGIGNTTYYNHFSPLINKLLCKRTVNTIVVCSKSDPNQLYGFISYACEEGVTFIHFIYIKSTYRKLGLAKQLLRILFKEAESETLICTFATPTFFRLREEKPELNLIYNPYLR